MPCARNSRLFTHLLFLLAVVAPLSAQITYETTYTTQTQNNTSACSAAGDNNGGCTSANTITGTKNNNPIPINTSKINPRTLLGSWFTGNVYGADMGWWQKQGHLCCVGYSSTNATEVQAQLQDMKSRGYTGMTMAWAGVKGSTCTVAGGFQNCTKDLSVSAFEQWLAAAAADGTFQVAIRGQKSMVDGTYNNTGETDQQAMIRQLQYVQSQYFSSVGYMKIEINGDGLGPRPIVTFFIDPTTCSGCDWAAIKSAVGHDVLFMKQDKNSYTMTGFEGGYSWGPAKEDSFAYENDFYGSSPNGAVNQAATKLVWSDASKGFNDENPNNLGHSIWDSTAPARFVDQRCGHRWLDTWGHVSTNYQNSTRRLDAVLVPTWNDYEEGTETETGISNCFDASNSNPITTTLTGNTLTWQDNWDQSELSRLTLTETDMEQTIYQYEFYESDPTNDEQLHLFYTLLNPSPYASPYSPAAHSLDLTQFSIPCNAKIYVKAIGQPSITNHMTSKAGAPASCGGTGSTGYTYITGLELQPTDWATLDDCGGTATCSTGLATSTVHTPPNAVKFTLAGNNPPGSQIGRWLRTVSQSTADASDFELDLWTDLDATAFSSSAGLIFELSHVYNSVWYHFAFKCDFSTWQIWDEVNNAWLATSIPCSRPPQDTYTRFTFHVQRLAGNMLHYKDVQVNGGTASVINHDLAAQTTTWTNFNKVGVKLMGNTAMNDYSLYVDDLMLGYR
jgi:hypothetical protein